MLWNCRLSNVGHFVILCLSCVRLSVATKKLTLDHFNMTEPAGGLMPLAACASANVWRRPTSQRTHDAITTSLWRQNDVATSFWRHNGVINASDTRWYLDDKYTGPALEVLIHWDRGKMVAILQAFSNQFSWKKIVIFDSNCTKIYSQVFKQKYTLLIDRSIDWVQRYFRPRNAIYDNTQTMLTHQ